MSYELGPIRPPAEAGSLLIRVTRGCPWNRCAFCTTYKSKNIEFSARTVDEIKKDVDEAYEMYKGHPFKSCFLQDGDIFCMPTDFIVEIAQYVKSKFKTLEKITSYGIIHKVNKKSQQELDEIRAAGINRVYSGMESGSDKVLRLINKGATSQMLIDVGLRLKKAGIEVSYFVMMGAGGKDNCRESALESARVLNEVDPEFIRLMSLRVKPGSGLERKVKTGEFVIPSEKDMVEEQLLMIENLNVTSYYSNDHIMNLFIEVEGQLPRDKEKLTGTLKTYLGLSDKDRRVFEYGVRTGQMIALSDIRNEIKYKKSENTMNRILKELNGQGNLTDAEILNYLRYLYTSS